MNEQTQKIVEDLSSKLGTTAEHLWGVLIKQAPISSLTDTILLIGLTVFVIYGYRIVKEKTKEGGDWNDNCGSIMFPWIAWTISAGILILIICVSASTIIAGFVNPEYWALEEILNSIK